MFLTLSKLITDLFGKFTVNNEMPIIVRVIYRNPEGILVAFDEAVASRLAGIDAPMIIVESGDFIRQEAPLNHIKLHNPLPCNETKRC